MHLTIRDLLYQTLERKVYNVPKHTGTFITLVDHKSIYCTQA